MIKKYIKPETMLFRLTAKSGMLESSYIDIGGKGEFDVKEQRSFDEEWGSGSSHTSWDNEW